MKLILNPKEDRRVKRGHCWIFSNEIKSVDINAKPGDLVSVYSSDDRFIGCGLYNPNSLISIRIVSNTNTELDSNWFKNKIAEALKFRLDLFSICLLYTSDAADERSSVDLGGRRIIKKKNKIHKR